VIELDAWLTFHERNKGHTPATVYNYRRAVVAFGAWLAEQKVEVLDATLEQLQRYAGEVLHLRGQSPSTRRISVSALRGYYKWLYGRKLIARDPAALLPFPRKGLMLPVPITADDAGKLLAQVDLATFKGVRDMAILSVLGGCGPRASGVEGLNESDLIFVMSEEGMEELTIRLREKGRHERYVPAPEEARLMVRAYLGHPQLEEIDRRLPDGDQVLFVNLFNSHVPLAERRGDARRLTKWSIYQMIQQYGEAAGINPRYLHPHAFRHLYGQELAETEPDVLVRQRLLGHRKVESTEIYSHIAWRKLRQAAAKANPLRRMKHPAMGLADRLKAARGG
jgi:integrase/recombinase XerD